MKIVIVIPIYRSPNRYELISLRRCCKVLCKYPMHLVCPIGVDTSVYQNLWNEYELTLVEERFMPAYFKDIAGYNRLLLSEEFYSRFSDYDYMLIYQPDAYIFEDRIEEWCNKQYDFVGAPLVQFDKDITPVDTARLIVGNGGLSLRKISTYISILQSKKHVFSAKQIKAYIHFEEKPYTRWLIWLLMVLGWRNTPKSIAAHYQWNEDVFWSCFFEDSQYRISKPTAMEALDFAFERYPSMMFEKNGCKLPMGCHAWHKYEFDAFWKKYILQ